MFLFNFDIFYSVLTYFVILGLIVILIFILIRKIVCWYFKINEIKNSQQEILDKLEFIETSLKESMRNRNKFNFVDTEIGNNIQWKQEMTEDERIKEIFKKSKNIVVCGLKENEKNIFTYFRAKQYNVMVINKNRG